MRGAWVPPGWGLYLTPFTMHWALARVNVVWLLSCVFWSLFEDYLYLLYFQKYICFWEEIPTVLLMPQSLLPLAFYFFVLYYSHGFNLQYCVE